MRLSCPENAPDRLHRLFRRIPIDVANCTQFDDAPKKIAGEGGGLVKANFKWYATALIVLNQNDLKSTGITTGQISLSVVFLLSPSSSCEYPWHYRKSSQSAGDYCCLLDAAFVF